MNMRTLTWMPIMTFAVGVQLCGGRVLYSLRFLTFEYSFIKSPLPQSDVTTVLLQKYWQS